MISLKPQLQRLQEWLQASPKALSYTLPSGLATLDKQLLNKGFMGNSITEIHYTDHSSQAFRLVLPLLLSKPVQCAVFINIQYCISPSFLAKYFQQGEFTALSVAQPKQLIWSIEQALKSRRCNAVLAWVNHNISFNHLRRLQLACQRGSTPLFLFRPAKYLTHASAAPLRLDVRPNNGNTMIIVAKQANTVGGHVVSVANPYHAAYRKTVHQLPMFTSKHCKQHATGNTQTFIPSQFHATASLNA